VTPLLNETLLASEYLVAVDQCYNRPKRPRQPTIFEDKDTLQIAVLSEHCGAAWFHITHEYKTDEHASTCQQQQQHDIQTGHASACVQKRMRLLCV
jgi:hypothetical protein